MRVLLVEDEPNIREALRFILARAGFDVSVHGDGASAASAAAAARPDVMILDVMLPGRSGYEVLRELRGMAGTATLPVLMLTARGQPKDRAAAIEAGATRFMTKPFSNDEVLAAVREMAGG